MSESRAYFWARPLWYCPDCGEGYNGSSDDESEVLADLATHNRMNHEPT